MAAGKRDEQSCSIAILLSREALDYMNTYLGQHMHNPPRELMNLPPRMPLGHLLRGSLSRKHQYQILQGTVALCTQCKAFVIMKSKAENHEKLEVAQNQN